MAPRARFELATFRLTAERSTVELPGSSLQSRQRRRSSESLDERHSGVNAAKNFRRGNRSNPGATQLLQSLFRGIVHDQVLENRQDVLAVLHHALQYRPQLRLA